LKYLIVGGTGTLGTCLIEKLLAERQEVTCFSRDELKQQDMKQLYPEVRYVIGDVRDKPSLLTVMPGHDVVFHVAALKHVDVLEGNPTESIKTNILGTINVAEAAMESGVKHLVFSSTDKAVLPINVYGMSKAISERYLLGLNRSQEKTRFAVYRWGNVLGSRGSAVHGFAKCLREHGGVKITDARMSRFWIHIEDAVDFMLKTYVDAPSDRPLIPPMKAAKVLDLAAALAEMMGLKKYDISFLGIRPGEKIHECLDSNHDQCLRSDTAEQYTKKELVKMLRRVVTC
jgi:UDP-N-acetylglucosamine 4,6-dehydratase